MVMMVSRIEGDIGVYEIEIREPGNGSGEVVWSRRVNLRAARSRARRREVVEAARDQERISFAMAASADPLKQLEYLKRIGRA
jgi:hypothetical protein